MIIFKTIRYKNILSTGNYWIEIKLDNNQNTLIVGNNGSGKSTMLDALCFALFGKAFRNINKPNLLNSINQKDCVVEVEFDTNNKSYKICRGIKPNIFEIYQDGILLNQDAALKDYQDILEKSILKLNYKSFTQIVILGSASFTPFMQLSAADRRSIIEDLLDIEIFSTMNNIVKDKISNNKDLITNKKYEIQLTEQKYKLEKQHIDELKQNDENKIKENEQEISNNQIIIQNLNCENSKLLSEVITLQTSTVDKSQIEEKIKKITKLESQIENNLSKIKKDIQFFEHNDNCPTCKQSIELHFKKKELETLNEKQLQGDDGLKKIETILLEEQNKLNEISEIQKKIQSLQLKITTNNTSITEINKFINKIQKDIEILKNKKTKTNKEQQSLEQLNANLLKFQDELKELLEQKSYFEVASNLLKDTGIKTNIVRQYLPIINKLINKYLTSLDFFVNFNFDESFKESIKSRHRDDFTYNNFSEGEKQKIDMSLMLTWRAIAKMKNSSNTNLLILDEIFDSSLDANGTDYLMQILQMLENVNLFVISHKGDVLQDKFGNVIRFEKIKNFSKIIK